MTTLNIDYATSYFKYKRPIPIQGAPSNKSLKRLKAELRANASSVETDLGGGDHGYLGLVLTDVEYAKINPTPPAFVPPTFPTPIVIPTGTTQVEALQLREQYKEEKRLYYECKNIEKALLRHIQTAIEEQYVEHLVDDDTQLIQDDVLTVLEYLFANYGKVPSEDVKKKESEVTAMVFNLADPMVTLYGPIEKLQKLARDAGIPYSVPQIIDFGLTIIRNTRDFEKALGEWNAKLQTGKTWDNFKSHFKDAQDELKEIRGPTMVQAGFHHANMLSAQLRNDLQNNNSEMVNMVQSVLTELNNHTDPVPTDTSTHTVNATIQDPVQLQMLQILQQMQQNMGNTNPNGRNNGNNNGGGGRRRTRKTPDNAKFFGV